MLDNWAPDRPNASQRRDLMEIVEDRYGTGSTLITSQLLDRLVHNACHLELGRVRSQNKTVRPLSPRSPPQGKGQAIQNPLGSRQFQVVAWA